MSCLFSCFGAPSGTTETVCKDKEVVAAAGAIASPEQAQVAAPSVHTAPEKKLAVDSSVGKINAQTPRQSALQEVPVVVDTIAVPSVSTGFTKTKDRDKDGPTTISVVSPVIASSANSAVYTGGSNAVPAEPLSGGLSSQFDDGAGQATSNSGFANVASSRVSWTSFATSSWTQASVDHEGAEAEEGPYATLRVNTWRLKTLPEIAAEISQLAWIGQGGFGIVYKGIWHGASVAVKFMRTKSLDLKSELAREVVLSQMLCHPNVVQAFATKVAQVDEKFLGEAEAAAIKAKMEATEKSAGSFVSGEGFGNPEARPGGGTSLHDILVQIAAKPGDYIAQIVMEYCDKGSLQRAIAKKVFKPSSKRSARLTFRAYLRTAREIAQGMYHIHKSNVIHGDLKPGNVLLSGSRLDRRGFIAKVSDFSLSQVCETSVVQTENWGTLAYTAPEAFNMQLTKASDIFAFGVLLWEIYVGERPYVGLRPGQIIMGVQAGDLRPQWPVDAPAHLVQLSLACMSHDRKKRPTFEEIANQLGKIENEVRAESQRHKEREAQGPSSPGGNGLRQKPSLKEQLSKHKYEQEQDDEENSQSVCFRETSFDRVMSDIHS